MDYQSTIRNKTPQYGIFENYTKHQTIENQLLAISGTQLAISLASETNGNIFSVSIGSLKAGRVKYSIYATFILYFAKY